jgi:hypothetical protein
MIRFLVFVLTTCLAAAGCRAEQIAHAPVRSSMNDVAEHYVKLVLAMGQHDPAYVDAYYGPTEWKVEAEKSKRPLTEIDADAARLLGELAAFDTQAAILAGAGERDREIELATLRHVYLRKQLEALRARVRMLSGAKLTFDEESQALYDAVAPTHPDSYFEGMLADLERRVAGKGPLAQRVEAFRQPFVIPRERLAKVFDLAIAECRRRTLPHIDLPAAESFTVEYVTGKSWSGYNWYHGNYRSVIQVNTDLPIYVDRAIDLACHEGYPGHHVYNALLEKNLTRDRGWPEFSIYALFSPQSLVAEGTANYGIDVAFSDRERREFERSVLFPAAGLNPARVDDYFDVLELIDRLSYAGNEAARRYLNGEIDRQAAVQWLRRFALMSPERAEQRTRFFDDYRSYVINYNLGKDLVKQFIESKGGSDTQPEKRWAEFIQLLGSPRLPSGLRP